MISPSNALNTVVIKRGKIKFPRNSKRGINNFHLMSVILDFEAANEDEKKLFFVIHFK